MAVPASHPLKNLADKEPFQTPGQQINRAKNERSKPFRIVKMEKLAGVNQPSGLSLGTGKALLSAQPAQQQPMR